MTSPNILDCGHPPTPTEGIGTGYARTPDDKMICYECADNMQRADMADPNRRQITAYISSDGKKIITWSGGELANITGHRTYQGGWKRSTMHMFWAIDPRTGRHWYGRNKGEGMIITLTARKGWKPAEER